MYTCQKADEYIEKNRVDRADKPEFHLTTPVGWLNDPNGFSIYGGKAHLFISSIHTARSGDLCTGDIPPQMIL